MKFQSLREVFEITEWKDGCVYRTRSVGYAWVTLDHESNNRNIMYCTPSTKVMKALEYKTMRRVTLDTNNVVNTTLEELGVK